jgi:PhoH-like ATPase
MPATDQERDGGKLDVAAILTQHVCTDVPDEVVVPLVVISELEAKRHHHELGWFARQALRLFDDLRLEHGRLDQPIPVGAQGGTLHVEWRDDNHVLMTGPTTLAYTGDIDLAAYA